LLGTGIRSRLTHGNQGRRDGNRTGDEADHEVSHISAPYHIVNTIDGSDPVHDVVCGSRPAKQGRTGRVSNARMMGCRGSTTGVGLAGRSDYLCTPGFAAGAAAGPA